MQTFVNDYKIGTFPEVIKILPRIKTFGTYIQKIRRKMKQNY